MFTRNVGKRDVAAVSVTLRRATVYEQIPVEVLDRYEGQWLVWDQDDDVIEYLMTLP